jgi:hypothetical protein
MNYYLQTFCYNHRLKELSEPTGQKWNNPACERTSYDAGFKLGLGGFKFKATIAIFFLNFSC